MKKEYSVVLTLLGIALLVFMVWYFSNVVIYVIISAVLSFIGQPLVNLLDKITIGKWKMPHTLSAVLTLLVMIMVFVGFFLFFVPLIVQQANLISQINMEEVIDYFREPVSRLQDFLREYGIIAPDQTIQSMLETQLTSLLSLATFSNFFGNLLSATSSFLMGLFSILFITFFFLQDESMLVNFIVLLTPAKYEDNVRNVMAEIHRMLSRYFLGLLTELVSMMTLISLGLTIAGIKGAIIIGFLGGLMNIIPYLGPLIGAGMGILLAVTTTLSTGQYDAVGSNIIIVIVVFATANLIVNFLLQPFIYSKSVKATPIEIFLVIIMAGTIAGIPGMILAIPAYTVIRIIAREFFNQFRLVRKLTDKM